jgi:hypothetical protein
MSPSTNHVNNSFQCIWDITRPSLWSLQHTTFLHSLWQPQNSSQQGDHTHRIQYHPSMHFPILCQSSANRWQESVKCMRLSNYLVSSCQRSMLQLILPGLTVYVYVVLLIRTVSGKSEHYASHIHWKRSHDKFISI